MEPIVITPKMYAELIVSKNQSDERLRQLRVSLAQAKSEGDLSENSAYDSYKHDLSSEQVVNDNLAEQIQNCSVVDGCQTSGTIDYLSTFTVSADTNSTLTPKETHRFTLISGDTPVLPDKITANSKLGGLALHKTVGDSIEYIDNNHVRRRWKIDSVE
jgi:transcription elongation GreA/GreB family factor